MTNTDQLILAKKPLVQVAVGSFLATEDNRGYAFLRDDLLSAAMVALVRGIKLGENRDSHLMTKMKSACYTEVDKTASTVRVPARTQRDAKKKGKPIQEIKCTGLRDDHIDPHSSDPLTTILECCKSGREREIVTLRATNFTDAEIAAQVGVCRSRISQIVADIESRYDADDLPIDRKAEKSGTAEPDRKSKGSDGKCWCGEPAAKWSHGEDDCRCELHFADSQQKYHGRSQSVRTLRSAQTSFALSA